MVDKFIFYWMDQINQLYTIAYTVTHTHTHINRHTVGTEPIKGRLRGRSVLRIDPDTGPLVAKRFTAGDFTRLVMTHNLDKHTQLHIISYPRKKFN